MITVDDLRTFKEFAASSDEHLAWLAERAEELLVPMGSEPFESGSPAEHMLLILDGEIRIQVKDGGQWRIFGSAGTGEITGLLPFSRMTHFTGRGEALRETRIARVHRDHFREMLYRMPEIGSPLVARMSDRVRVSTRSRQEREKMQALGKLAAGLAHELNNPAAAVRRASDAMRERLDRLPGLVTCLARHGLDATTLLPAGQLCTLDGPKQKMTALALGEREDELLDWLEDREVGNAWELAPTLAEAGVTTADLEGVIGGVPAKAVQDIVLWIDANLAAHGLLHEIHSAAGRVSELVGSIKAYSHMDRDPNMQLVDLREGIDSTLTMLGHKLRASGVEATIVWPDDVPAVPVLPGEMNQVWTNLIDNAVDAMPDGGTLAVRAQVDATFVSITVGDTGSGIPPHVLPRIFEPFYTTKDIGQGTGLGLDIVHRIVTEQHAGDIRVESEPGRTVFTVRLPLQHQGV